MKIILAGLLLLGIAQNASPCEMPEGLHEYGTFGEGTVYLYHFPVFGSIHAYQVLVEADLMQNGKNVNESYFAARKAYPNALFMTTPTNVADGSPDYWVLPDYSKVGAAFNAKIHYRADGKDNVLFSSVLVTVKHVLWNRLLRSTAERSPDLQYLYFGNSNESYLLHLAAWDPDFDQVLSVVPLPDPGSYACPVPVKSAMNCPGVLTFKGHPNTEATRLKSGDEASAGVPVRVLKELVEFKIDLNH